MGISTLKSAKSFWNGLNILAATTMHPVKNPPKPVYTKSPSKGSPGSMKSLILDDAEAPLGCAGMHEGKICPPKTNIFNLKITAFEKKTHFSRSPFLGRMTYVSFQGCKLMVARILNSTIFRRSMIFMHPRWYRISSQIQYLFKAVGWNPGSHVTTIQQGLIYRMAQCSNWSWKSEVLGCTHLP